MTSATFSMRMDRATKKALEDEARRMDRSAAWVANAAIAGFLDRAAYKREQIAALITEADKGVFVSEERMMAAMERWADGHEEPPPEPDIFPSVVASEAAE
jgi:predicted transcriptional regulator